MKKTIRRRFIFMLLLLSTSVIACGTPETDENTKDPTLETPSEVPSETPEETPFPLLDKWTEVDCFSFSYKQLGKNVMPIGAWCAPTGDYNTNEQYKLVKEAGLNSVYGLYENYSLNSPEVMKALDYAANNDIVYLVRDSGMVSHTEETDDFKEYIKKYTTHKAYGGTLLIDEPGVKQIDNYLLARKLFRSYLPKDAFYFNLLPNYANKGQLENGAGGGENTMNLTYEQYVRAFLEKLQPQFFRYDYYGTNKDFPNVSKGYLDQLYVNSKLAHEYKIPLWPFIQACEYGGSTRVPNEIDIYWQVNVSLAYGAKGIQYFCYFQPPEFSSVGYEGSFINKEGKPTDIYYAGQKINKQIARMDHILMNSTLMCQMVFGDSPCTINQDNLVTSYREIKSITTEDDLLIGCFDYGGKSVYYLVNNNLTENCEATIDFTSLVRANLFYMTEDKLVEGDTINVSLKPGEGVLLELTNYK